MPVSSVRRKASSFIWATISNSPSRASVTTAVIRPDASKRGIKTAPSSVAFLSESGEGKIVMVALLTNKVHETHLLINFCLESAGEGGRNRAGTLFADTAHGHAHMFGIYHDSNAARLENALNAVCDLRGDAFL